MKIVEMADSFRRELYEIEKLEPKSPVLKGLASGLDVGLTLFESSIGAFNGLTQNMAEKIRQHFLNESRKYRANDIETSIWYFSYALALEQFFLQRD